MVYYMYKVTNKTNNKFYIGVHSTDNINDGYMGSGVYLKKAFKKYGMKHFTKEVLSYYNTREEMLKAERETVNESLLKNRNCYNVALGGQAGIPEMVPVIDEEGNSFIVHKDDIRFKSGLLKHNLKGTSPVLDENGKYFRISVNDPDYISGKYKHNTKELKWIVRDGEQLRENVNKIKDTDKLARNNIQDTIVIHKDNINRQVKKNKLKEYLGNGWDVGRICKKKYMWIVKGDKQLFIQKDDIYVYLTDGWITGKLPTTDKRI